MIEEEIKLPRLLGAAREFNIGQDTLIDFLISQGFDKQDLQPSAKLTKEMYDALKNEFQKDIYKPKFKESRRLNGPVIVGKIDFPTSNNLTTKHLSKASENALGLIKKCLLNRDSYLDLGRCGLTGSDFSLGSQVDKELQKCKHLETLILSNEWWALSVNTGKWEKVFSRNSFPNNYLHFLPMAIKSLRNLTKLICCGEMENKWGIIDVENIKFLKGITYLDIRDNKINDLNPLQNLNKLTILIADRNEIVKIDKFAHMVSLVHLAIHSNYIDDTIGIEKLTSLRILDIHNNKIRQLTGLESLANIKELYLQDNEIEDIDGLEFILDRTSEIYIEIDENPFVKNYQLKLLKDENHFPFIREVLKRQMDTSIKKVFNYPIKILLLGNHASGKSSLLNYLTNKSVTGSTHILRIENYYIDKKNSQIFPDGIFFDFGGQDFYHGLYQAFMSNDSLKILLFTSQNDRNSISIDNDGFPVINFNRRYWLGQKNYFEDGGIDPYVIVQSYADRDSQEADAIDYNEFYGYKKTFFLALNTLLTSGQKHDDEEYYEAGRNYFKSFLNNFIKKSCVKAEEPKWYVDFLKFIINKNDKTHLPTDLEAVLIKYNANELTGEDKRESLKINLITLHRHGLILYYHNIILLENIVWLDPQKLVEHIQKNILNKIIDTKTHKIPGIVSKTNFENVVNDKKILILLTEQKIIFLHAPTNNEEDNEYIIPNYLPLFNKSESDSQLFTFGLNKPDLVIKFNNFIPFGFINQMICFFGKQPDVKKFWRNQLLFTISNEARVLIELDFEELKINIHYQFIEKSQSDKSLLNEYLFFCILALYWNFKNESILTFKEFVFYKTSLGDDSNAFKQTNKFNIWQSLRTNTDCIPHDVFLSIDNQRFISYLELRNLTREFEINSFSIEKGIINFKDVLMVPADIYKSFTPNKILSMKKVFISYSKTDAYYLTKLENHLTVLKRNGNISTWNCRQLLPGEKWDGKIKNELEGADVIIFLVSDDFLATEYIWDVEIKRAIERENENPDKVRVIPIILRSCFWEESPLSIYNTAPKKAQVLTLAGDIDEAFKNAVMEIRNIL